jgi:hypothetical protein|tara:strand:+ start:415 stop:621 length:207 start_codon:yes stop_codon:yes gene_type:complete
MKIRDWIKIEETMTKLMGWDTGIEAMCDSHREVAPKKPIYELSDREDKKVKYRLRKRYLKYKEDINDS